MRHEVSLVVPAGPALQLSRHKLIAFALAAAYALFVVLFPWDSVSRAGFSDFDSYVVDFNRFSAAGIAKSDLRELSSVQDYFVSEVLWHELVRKLTDLTGEASIALRIVSFFILFVWGAFLFQRVTPGIALLFLFNPTAIDVAMSGIRNGLAWALVIIGLSVRGALLRFSLFLIGSMIHSSTLVLLVLYYFVAFARKFFQGKSIMLPALSAGAFIGLALTIGSTLVLGAIGDRRVGEEYVVGGGSFLQASMWAILLFLQCLSGREYIRQNAFVIAVLAWYETMNPFIPWSFRVWSALLPVIAVSALSLPAQKRQIFTFLYPGYLILQYLYWSKLFEYWYVP
jgi:hypothetical protein